MGETIQKESSAREEQRAWGGTLGILKFRSRQEGKDHEKETPKLQYFSRLLQIMLWYKHTY